MKIKFLVGFAVLAMLAFCVSPVLAVKPAGNLASVQTVPWHLSAAVMPVPPYGSPDIPGSDVASKLLVNQPNGAVETTITGVMKGLNPNTDYIVYLSKSYIPYVNTGWSITGTWVFNVQGGYTHTYEIAQIGNSFTGTGGYPAGTGPSYSIYEKVSGTIDPMTGEVTITAVYYSDSERITQTGYTYSAELMIAADGSMAGEFVVSQVGLTIVSTSGAAVKTHTGSTGWSGLFTSTVQPFTFTADASGSGSWHLNLRDSDFAFSGEFPLSVWINEAGRTMLISDNFNVIVVK